MEAELEDFGPGRAEIRIPLRYELSQQDGVAHGGVTAYAVDNAMAFAAGSVLGKRVVTADTSITYLRPALAGGVLIATATVADHAGRWAVCRCGVSVVRGNDGTLVAVAQGTVRVPRAKPTKQEGRK